MAGIDYLAEAEGALVIAEMHLQSAVKLLAHISSAHQIDLGTAAADAGLEYKSVSYILLLAQQAKGQLP